MPVGKIKTEIKPYSRSMSYGALSHTHKHTQRWCAIMEAIDYESLGDILIVFSGNKSKCRLCMYADLKDV